MSEDTRLTSYSQEIASLAAVLSKAMRPEFIETWLASPNEALGGISPREAIERGENDRVWRVVFLLGSGLPI